MHVFSFQLIPIQSNILHHSLHCYILPTFSKLYQMSRGIMSSPSSFTLFLVATMTIVAGASNKYKVGDHDGWLVPPNNDPALYENWAAKIKFLVGDSIVFEYQNDSVVKVSKKGYYHCDEAGRDLQQKDGDTEFLLDKPGFYYFVSGVAEHCKRGQRLMVEVTGVPGAPGSPSPAPLLSGGPVSCTVVAFSSSLLSALMTMAWCMFPGLLE